VRVVAQMYRAGIEGLPVAHFAFPGPLRDRLVAAILSGEKTATSSLRLEYDQPGEDLPEVGSRGIVVDSAGRPVCVIEITDMQVLRLDEVDERFARDEGEGFESVEEWRSAHEAFWRSPEWRNGLGGLEVEVDDETLVVAERFRVVERFD
jgi:uncharacterized protein YhfF